MLRYPGGKFKARKMIYAYAPFGGYKELREPFMGGGSLLWDAPEGVRLWFNDLNPLVADYWTTLRDDDSFIAELLSLREHLMESPESEQHAVFDDARFSLHCLRRVLERDFAWHRFGPPPTWEQFLQAKAVSHYSALDYLVCDRYAVGAMVRLSRHDICAFSSAFNTDGMRSIGMRSITSERLEQLRSVLRGPECTLTCLDYSVLIQAPGDNVWLMLDPPYLMNHHQSPIYELPFGEQDHLRLAGLLRATPHKWLMTLGDAAFNLDLYRGMNVSYLSSPGDPDPGSFFYSTYLDWREQERMARSEGRTPRHRVLTFKSSQTNHISPEFLAEQRRRYAAAGRLWIFQREHESEWVTPVGQFFEPNDIKQCVEQNLPAGGRLDSYVWSMDPGGRRSPAVIMVGRCNQSLSRVEVVDVRSFIFESKYKPNDGHESIAEYEELVDVCVDLRRKYPPIWFGVDPNTEKSLTERLRNSYQFPIEDLCVGSYNTKLTFLRDLQRALAERKVLWSDRRVTEQLLRFAPTKNERTGRYDFPDKHYDLIVCLGMLVRYLGDRLITPFIIDKGGRAIW